MSTQRFVDALSGADGTQALRVRYEVPPVYPDATVLVPAVRRSTTAPQPVVRVPEIDPRVARAVSELAAVERPGWNPPARSAPRPDARAPRAPRAPAAPPPTRAQAARAGFYQGPTPTAIGPVQAARHQRPVDTVRPPFLAAPGSPPGLAEHAGRLKAQLGQFGQQFGTGNPRTPPAMPSSPQQGPRSTVPASAFQPPAPQRPPARRLANTVQIAVSLLIVFLVVSGLGAQLIDLITDLIQR